MKAFVETTVLTDLLLKRDGSEVAAKAALDRYANVLIPQFAWKEFKRGPLAAFKWMHNKLAETSDFALALIALQRLSRTPMKYKTSTAIQAVHTAFASYDKMDFWKLQKKYGRTASAAVVIADIHRLHLKDTILRAWKKRKALGGGAYHPLSCYPDENIRDNAGRLDLAPTDCPESVDCCLRQQLTGRSADLRKLRDSLVDVDRQEVVKRRGVLKHLEKRPSQRLNREQCRALGDAYFVLFCPDGATVLTTNRRDIDPMASAIGKAVASP